MRQFTAACAAALLWIFPQVSSAGEPLWIHEMAEEKDINTEIKWHRLTDLGAILIGGDFGLVALDPETGQALWQKRDLGEIMEPQAVLLRGTPVMFVSADDPESKEKSHVIAYNVIDGSQLWKSAELPGTTFGLYLNVEQSQVLAVTAPVARHSKLASGIRKGELTINVLDLATGQTQWTQKLPGEKAKLLVIKGSAKIFMHYSLIGHQPPIFEEGTGIFAFNDKIVKYNMDTGEVIWTSKAKIKKTYNLGLASKTLEISDDMFWNATQNARRISAGDDIYFSHDKRVMKFSKSDGSLVWKSKELDAQIHEMRLHDGILYARAGGSPERVKSELGMKKPVWAAFDPANGKRIWKYDKLKDQAASMLFHKGVLFVAAGKKMVGLDPANGKRLQEIKLPEKGTSLLMPQGERLIALSQQGAAAIDPVQGKLIWHKYYEAPGLSKWVQMASMAMYGMIALYGEMQQLSAQADIQTLEIEAKYDQLDMTARQLESRIDRDLSMFGSGIENVDMANDMYKEAMSIRYQSAAQSNKYMFFLVKLKKQGPGLLGLDLETGDVIQEAPLETKKPDFEIDEVEGRVFVFQKRKVKALPLK